MLGITSLVMWMAAGAPSVEAASVAVFPLVSQVGVDAGTAGLVADAVLAEIKTARAFSRVMSSTDLETVVGLERQRQLLDCTSASCLSELAGAMGVTYVCTGSLGRLGDVHQLSLRLVNANTGQLAAAVTRRADGTIDQLVKAVPDAVDQLLDDAGIRKGAIARATPTGEPASDVHRSGPPRWVLGTFGAASAGIGTILGVVSIGAVVIGVVALMLPFLVYIPLPVDSYPVRLVLTRGPAVFGFGGGAILLAIALPAFALGGLLATRAMLPAGDGR